MSTPTSAMTATELLVKLSEVVAEYPDAIVEFTQPISPTWTAGPGKIIRLPVARLRVMKNFSEDRMEVELS